MKLRKQYTVVISRDYITRRITVERRDFGALIDRITFTEDEFLDLREQMKDMKI